MKAYELLATPDKWTKRVTARDKLGNRTGSDSNSACSFCLYGALVRCYPLKKRIALYDKIQGKLNTSPISWNDEPTRTHAEVLTVLKELDI